MGFAVPAAIGAKVGRPDRMVWAVDGDGCFQMTAQELVTAATERIPVKVAILNNAYLGMVRQWQEMFYEERYSEVYLSPDLPDYEKWAEAMGCVGIRVESPEEVAAGHRQGQRDRRPPGRHRVPHRLLARRCSRWSPPARRNDDIVIDPAARRRRSSSDRATTSSTTSSSVLVENKPACSPGSPACSPGGASTSTRLAVAPTDDERFSRITIVVDVESAPLEQMIKQLDKLINVVKITELDPRRLGRARAAAGHRDGAARRSGARSSSWCRSSRAGSSTSATTS